jgi:NADH-quinone oxidoreductase subunit F
VKIILKNIENEGYKGTISDYISAGGYESLKKTLSNFKPDEVIEEVKKSNLRGRGGDGFPTGVKWGFIPKDSNKPKYLICNADEGEPGTFKDRVIMEKEPHMLLEGMIISSYAFNANKAFIYIRGEFVYAANVLNKAIDEARDQGFLGKNILNSGFDLEIYVYRGAGAYICGEETGLIESLEGKRGWPRIKPPFPAIEGAYASPTIVNNVETLAFVPFIMENGGEKFASIGVKGSTGTKLFCLSGHVNKPGVYEIPCGIPLMDLINDYGGGVKNGNKVKAVIPGGSSFPVLTADELDVTMDFDSLAEKGSGLGSAAVIIMDETTCMVNTCLNIAKFYAHESCGQCTPCREGMPWMKDILQRIYDGNGKPEDLDMLEEITHNIEGKTICPFGEAGAWPVRAFVTKFRSEFEEYIEKGKKPS